MPHKSLRSSLNVVAILDAGAQYTKVIDRRIRALCVETTILPLHTPVHTLRQFGGIVVTGGLEVYIRALHRRVIRTFGT